MENIFFFFFKIIYQFFKSLDLELASNIFKLLDVKIYSYNFFSFNFQQSLDLIICNVYFYVTICGILYIYFALLRNMFSYSINYFFATRLFDYQQLPSLYTNIITARERLVQLFFNVNKYSRKTILVYQQADTMSTILSVLSILVVFNLMVYTNIINLNLPGYAINFPINFNIMKWISVYFDSINFGLVIDNLSLLMLVVVLTISTLVHYYSIDYMATDPWLITFLKYLSGFTLAMVTLVTANNLALLFLGWEGVGIFSYLLIGFWYTRTLALKASLKAVIVNRIGDVALIIATGLTLQYFGTIEFSKLQMLFLYLINNKLNLITIDFTLFNFSVISLICFFLLIAAVGKSAQFGLHSWLPDAMEGPTPVSALIHAATMVTAGVYLIVWMSFFFEYSDSIRALTLFIGAFTALFGSITACFQHDIKWIIAFSTCSQLGYMFLACGLSAYNLAMFHLFIHAFFKALLFLCAGSVIHAIGDEQDIRKMGGLLTYLPLTYAGLCMGFISLAGLPFTSGFFSKDTIIELAMTKRTVPAVYGYICGSLAAWFTAFYSFRFFFYVIFASTHLSWTVISNAHEHGKNMLTVIVLLTFTTIFIGGLTKNPLTSPFSFIFYTDSIFIRDVNFYFNLYENLIEFYWKVHHYVFNYLKWILFIVPFSALYISVVIFWFDERWHIHDQLLEVNDMPMKDKNYYSELTWADEFYTDGALQRFFETKGTTDQIYNRFIVKPILDFSYLVSYKELDRGWLEYILIKVPTLVCFLISKNLNQSYGSLKLNFLPALLFITTVGLLIFYAIFNN